MVESNVQVTLLTWPNEEDKRYELPLLTKAEPRDHEFPIEMASQPNLATFRVETGSVVGAVLLESLEIIERD